MCGIAGFAGIARYAPDAAEVLRRMCDAIRHRGPDDAGYFVGPTACIGMRRLSIIDVAGGHQPMANEDESVRIVFNGEIYNFRDLRQRLRVAGHRLATSSDTETIVHFYEERGEDVVHELRGMFAFAIWDEKRQRLVLARDRLGIKPLYVWPHPSGGLAFASELRSFLTLPDFAPTIDPDAVASYSAFGYIPHPASIFRGVRKLAPGHRLTWTRDQGIVEGEYWSPARAERPAIDEREAVAELRRLIDESVRIHLESDVPLGAFLSGGIDSSAVVASMRRQMDSRPLTFSIGFREAAFDESGYAAEVANALDTNHTALIVDPDADSLVDDVVHAFDEPMGDSSALPTYLVSCLARRDVTVALSGDGGDEGFGGYTRYIEALSGVPQLPSLLRGSVSALASALPLVAPGRNWLLNLARSPRGRYASTVAAPVRASEGGVMRDEIAARHPTIDQILEDVFNKTGARDFTTQLMVVDLLSYLPGDILTKVDRMSMAPSLEARVPLLDHVVIEFAVSLPPSLKMRDGVGKWLLRRAIQGTVPDTVLTRPKQGFGVPLSRWFRRELSHRIDQLLSPSSTIYEFYDPARVRGIVTEHRAHRRDHSGTIWRLMLLDLWLRALARGTIARAVEPRDFLAEYLDRATS
ncbi:MAG TPA: asparagine synthase (glutamine-hydrolyzing) [Gemmatimonadaceae bacterium]|jgi:asparagine synthase (glutamine-hydrolysing)|nr:asparagine synthase (glutamine-hydrolyzing) [Gemmatimonadaceae bacterium]